MDSSKGWESIRDPKGQTGRRPIMGRRAKPSTRKTLRFVEFLIVRLGARKNERGRERRRCSFPRICRGRAGEVGKLKRATVPTRAKDSGSNQGHGFLGGNKPLERRGKVTRFCRKAQERRGESERVFRSPGRIKALKSEAHERGGLKEIPKGLGAKPSHREGSQTLGWDYAGTGQCSRAASAKAGVKRRALGSGNAEGHESLREVRSFPDHGRHGTGRAVASAGARRFRWRRSAREESPSVFERDRGGG
jgi:hypothetical protein